jgi:pimeloyl-ACP methyl ester carboxylesterase
MMQKKETAVPVKRPFVLVHGSWHGGWCWREVAKILRAAGHEVFTPTQTGVGERAHLLSEDITLDTFVEDVTNVIRFEDLNEVVLVGHSFGGNTISGVADLMPERLHHLVYLDSMILENGQSSFDILPPEVVAARTKASEEYDGGLSTPPPKFQSFGILDDALGARVMRFLTPHPMSVNRAPLHLKHPIGSGVAKTYVMCTAPVYTPLAASRDYVRHHGWPVVELAAGHDAMLTAPEKTAALFLSLAR